MRNNNCLLPQIHRNAPHEGKTALHNTLLSEKTSMPLDGRLTGRNNHIFAFGASQDAIREHFIIPNILQGNTSYIVHDATGELSKALAPALEKLGYEVRIMNLADPTKSSRYNPFRYIQEQEDILELIYNLFQSTPSENLEDSFFGKAERLLMQAICSYLHDDCRYSDQSLFYVHRLLSCGSEEDENEPSTLDILSILFGDLEKKDSEHIAVQQFNTFRQIAPNWQENVIRSCRRRVEIFGKATMEKFTSIDFMDLDTVGNRPMAIFCIPNSEDDAANVLIPILYHQAIRALYRKQEEKYTKKEQLHPIRIIWDDFENIPNIHDLCLKLNTAGKYKVSFTFIVKSITALKALYGEDCRHIYSLCDTHVFFGIDKENVAEEDQHYLRFMLTCNGFRKLSCRHKGASHPRAGPAPGPQSLGPAETFQLSQRRDRNDHGNAFQHRQG